MMYSLDDFNTIEKLQESKASEFDTDSRVDKMARTLLVTTSNLELIKEQIETTPDLAGHVEDKHKFQHNLVHTSAHALYSVYRSTKYHSYNSSFRDIRFLIESWLILRGLNQRIEQAGHLWDAHRDEAKSLDGGIEEHPVFDFESIDELGRIRDSERDKLYNQYPAMRQIINYISQRAGHPLRIDGSYLEGVDASGQKFEQLYFSLALLFAITKEYEKTLEGTQLAEHISEYVGTISDQVKYAMPNEVPAFLSPYLD